MEAVGIEPTSEDKSQRTSTSLAQSIKISLQEKPTSRFNPELSWFFFALLPQEKEEGYPVYLDALT